MNAEPEISKENKKLIERHPKLIYSQLQKVVSHVQREQGDWIINTVMLEGYDVPFRYKRKEQYKNLQGARVNLTYYATTENVAGFNMEIMNVVKIRRS